MGIELADIMHRFGPSYLERFSDRMPFSHKKVISDPDVHRGRTEGKGGHIYQCEDCGKKVYVYHACRNRHCPACHRDQIHQWLEQRTTELLPCDYFHVTVTIPDTLHHVFRSNQKRMYDLLMRTASESLIQLADDPKHLGRRIGILAVLQTWTNNLAYHPHVHMLVTGGGVNGHGRWTCCKNKYLVPVKALSKLIRRKFKARLKKRHKDLYRHVNPMTWSKNWVANSLHYGQGEHVVLNYLARYVFRIAVTNHRLISMDESHVTLRYKDHDTGQWKTERLYGVQFLRRFLFHVLPKGLHKVRYYGLWHPCKRDRQAQARLLLELTTAPVADNDVPLVGDLAAEALAQSSLESHDHRVKCPKCGSTNVLLFENIRRRKAEIVTWPTGGP